MICLIELKQGIKDVVNQVNQNMLVKTWRELHRPLKWLKEHYENIMRFTSEMLM